MHRWTATFLACGLGGLAALACGPASDSPVTESSASGSGSGSGSDGASTAVAPTTGDDPPEYVICDDPPYESPDVFESPDTQRFMAMLAQAIVDAGYGEAARVEYGQMVSNTGVRFCSTVSVHSHWYASSDYACFEKGTDDEMRAQFAAYLAQWSPLPETMISLAELETIVNGCFAGIYSPYVPCETGTWKPYVFELTYSGERWVDACNVEYDVATVDLATGALLKCETQTGGGGCESEG
jgi:hypothetical protein